MNAEISEEIANQIKTLIFAGSKIEAIKLYREHTHQGLKESKDYIEALEAELRAKEPLRFTAPARKGCLGSVVFLSVAGLIILAVLASLMAR